MHILQNDCMVVLDTSYKLKNDVNM